MKVKVYKDKGGKWRWVMTAANGKKVATSGESFSKKSNAVRAAKKFLKSVKIRKPFYGIIT